MCNFGHFNIPGTFLSNFDSKNVTINDKPISFFFLGEASSLLLFMKLHSVELRNLNSSTDTIRQVKSRKIRWLRHVACMGEE
jgi:hypothetical protein